MLTFSDISVLNTQLCEGWVTSIPEQLQIQDTLYTMVEHEQVSCKDLASNNVHITYISENLNKLVLTWKLSENLSFTSLGATLIEHNLLETIDIGFTEQVVIQGINGDQPIESKIDTGADMCSLHATNIVIDSNTVQFQFNERKYRMRLSGTQPIKQAGAEASSRPIILVTLTIAGTTLKNIECNLSDRSDMTPLLIGKNALTNGDFTISTQSNEMQSDLPQ